LALLKPPSRPPEMLWLRQWLERRWPMLLLQGSHSAPLSLPE